MRRSDSEAIEIALETDPEDALALVQQKIEEGESDPEWLAYRAEALEAVGRRREAINAWTAYLERDPAWPGTYCRRAELLADGGSLDAARAELLMAGELFEDEPRLLRVHALLDELEGAWEDADRKYGAVAEIDCTLPAPPRFDRREAAQVLAVAAGHAIVLAELPARAGDAGWLRALDVGVDGEIKVYLRNLEREMESEATAEDLADLFEIARLQAGAGGPES